MTKQRYHISGYFSDFVEAHSEDEAMDLFADIFANAKRSDIIWEVQDITPSQESTRSRLTIATKPEFEEWCELFEPVVNHLSDGASFDDGNGGVMFETYGKELDYVLAVAKLKPLHVWTYMDGKHHPIICEGYHLVNRIGYFITNNPCELKTHYEIIVSEL